jgi:probable HAF family extracellular repeat protein
VGDDPNRRGFLLDRGKVTRIDLPGATYTQPTGINNLGQVVGEYQDAAGRFHGFLWQRGRFANVDLPGAAATSATAINDRGQIVGLRIDDLTAQPPVVRGFLLDKGRSTTIDPSGAPITFAFGLNNRGQIVGFTIADPAVAGFRGFLLAKGAGGPAAEIRVPGATSTSVSAINDLGQLVGAYGNPNASPGWMARNRSSGSTSALTRPSRR